MRKLYNVARDTSVTATARTVSADFSNVGMATHLVFSWDGTYSSGTATAGVLAGSLLDVMLEGHGKIIDNLTIQQCASIADLEGGAVVYKENTGTANQAGVPKVMFAIPLGLVDVSDDVLKVRLTTFGSAATLSAQTISMSLACLRDGFEVGYFLYERFSFAFTASGQRLSKDLRAYGYDRVYLSDYAGIVSQFEVKPDNAPESYGYIEALQAFNFCCTRQESIASDPTAWNKMYLLNDERSMSADSAQSTVAVIASGSGTVEVVTRRRMYRPQKVLASKGKYAVKQANVRMIEVQQNPQAARAKAFVKGQIAGNSALRKF